LQGSLFKINMKAIVISYSLTGNNDILATSIAKELAAEHIKITESKQRTTGTIFFDLIFNRTPNIDFLPDKITEKELVILVGPIWMGHVATPLRKYFSYLKNRPNRYAYVSISGGAIDSNPKLGEELKKRIGKVPLALIDWHIADLLPSNPKPTTKETSSYHLNDNDIKSLTEKTVKILRKTMSD
jgi:hypothetical protein